MTNTTITKVETKWDLKKIQEKTAKVVATVNLAAIETLSKFGPEAILEFQSKVRAHKVESLKAEGVKTPLQLVKALAETEHNLFGSIIEISGDDTKATMTYKTCAMWDAMSKIAKFSPEQEVQMTKNFENCASLTAKEFGFNGTTTMDKEVCTLTFTK